MNLPIGLAIMDQMNGGQETRQRMNGWMNQESKLARHLRTISAQALIALAARLTPDPIVLPEPQRTATPELPA